MNARAHPQHAGAADRKPADDAVPATHNPIIHQALGTPDKEYVRIKGRRTIISASPISWRNA